jgi:hypothetical protein
MGSLKVALRKRNIFKERKVLGEGTMRNIFIAIWIAFLTIAVITDWAQAGSVRLGHISSGHLKAICDKNGGTFNSGEGAYGCTGSGGQVNCTKSGKCTGTCPNCGARQAGTGVGGIIHPTSGVNTKGQAANQGSKRGKGSVSASPTHKKQH